MSGSESEGEDFTVEKILDSKGKGKKLLYQVRGQSRFACSPPPHRIEPGAAAVASRPRARQVKWVGFPVSEATWEPPANCTGPCSAASSPGSAAARLLLGAALPGCARRL